MAMRLPAAAKKRECEPVGCPRSASRSGSVRCRERVDVERSVEFDARGQNAGAFIARALFAWDRAPFGIRQPKAQQVTFARRLRPVFIGTPRMQSDVIVEE